MNHAGTLHCLKISSSSGFIPFPFLIVSVAKKATSNFTPHCTNEERMSSRQEMTS